MIYDARLMGPDGVTSDIVQVEAVSFIHAAISAVKWGGAAYVGEVITAEVRQSRPEKDTDGWQKFALILKPSGAVIRSEDLLSRRSPPSCGAATMAGGPGGKARTCELKAGHEGKHEATYRGERLTWEDTPRRTFSDAVVNGWVKRNGWDGSLAGARTAMEDALTIGYD